MKEDKEMGLTVETVAEKRSNYVQRALDKRIRNRSAKLGVIGLGYVASSLAIEMAKKGFRVTGIDIDGGKVEAVNAGLSYVLDVPNDLCFPWSSTER
jgi:UDP-N-acetyl-D-glucosamine dehydrogenase